MNLTRDQAIDVLARAQHDEPKAHALLCLLLLERMQLELAVCIEIGGNDLADFKPRTRAAITTLAAERASGPLFLDFYGRALDIDDARFLVCQYVGETLA